MKEYKVFIGDPKITKDFIFLRIYKTMGAMRAVRARLDGRVGKKTWASCFISNKYWHRKSRGVMIFYENGFTPGIIMHEVTHAALGYYQLHLRKKIKYLTRIRNEERFADLIGWMAHNIQSLNIKK